MARPFETAKIFQAVKLGETNSDAFVGWSTIPVHQSDSYENITIREFSRTVDNKTEVVLIPDIAKALAAGMSREQAYVVVNKVAKNIVQDRDDYDYVVMGDKENATAAILLAEVYGGTSQVTQGVTMSPKPFLDAIEAISGTQEIKGTLNHQVINTKEDTSAINVDGQKPTLLGQRVFGVKNLSFKVTNPKKFVKGIAKETFKDGIRSRSLPEPQIDFNSIGDVTLVDNYSDVFDGFNTAKDIAGWGITVALPGIGKIAGATANIILNDFIARELDELNTSNNADDNLEGLVKSAAKTYAPDLIDYLIDRAEKRISFLEL